MTHLKYIFFVKLVYSLKLLTTLTRSSILRSFENDIDLPFHLAFPTGIYLLKINSKNKNTLCEKCPKLTRKAQDQMCETNFLQMCLFYVILTSLHSLNPRLFYVISTAMFKFPAWFLASQLWFSMSFAFPPRFPVFSHWFPVPAFPLLFFAFPLFHSLILHFSFYR